MKFLIQLSNFSRKRLHTRRERLSAIDFIAQQALFINLKATNHTSNNSFFSRSLLIASFILSFFIFNIFICHWRSYEINTTATSSYFNLTLKCLQLSLCRSISSKKWLQRHRFIHFTHHRIIHFSWGTTESGDDLILCKNRREGCDIHRLVRHLRRKTKF